MSLNKIHKGLLGNTYDTISSVNTTGVELPYQYQSMLDANPYRGIEYTKSPWQKFLSWLGFRTEADAWKENMAVQANEYDAGIVQKAYDEDYNDAQSQVQRMKAAGLNPDLDPSSVSPGESASMGEDPSVPMQTTGEESQVYQFATGIMSIASTAIGLVGSIQGISRNHNHEDSRQPSNAHDPL